MEDTCTTLSIAKEYVKRGFSVIPLQQRGKKPALPSWREFQGRRATEEELNSWFGNGSCKNIGIIAGTISELVILDADSAEAVEWCEANLPQTPSVNTARGRHYYFRYKDGIRNSVNVNGMELDVRGEGGYVVAPPSVHETGVSYLWVDGKSLDDVALADFPTELFGKNEKTKALSSKTHGNHGQAAIASELTKLAGAVESTRNDQLNKSAFALGQYVPSGELDRHNAETALLRMAMYIGLSESEARGTIKSGIDAGISNPAVAIGISDESSILEAAGALSHESLPEDISGVIQAAATSLKPVALRKAYEAIRKSTGLTLTTIREEAKAAFKEAKGGEANDLELAREVIDTIESDNLIHTGVDLWRWFPGVGVWCIVDDRKIKQDIHEVLEKHSLNVTSHRVNSVAELLKTETFKVGHQWSTRMESVNVLNGELDLESDEWVLKPHVREHYLTTQVPVSYDPNADAPRFRQYLEEIFKNDEDGERKATAILESMGYTLMSHTRHERFIMLVGKGANGKSVLLAVIRALVGKRNCAAVQPSNFNSTFQRAHLHNKLANVVSELKEGAQLADEALKSIVSGEATTVERKFKDPFEIEPYATCWFGTNHLPYTNDFSAALFRRVLVVPFNREFVPGKDADPKLMDELTNELPGIMNLALKAYAEALRRGTFTEPKSTIQAKHEWRLEVDQAAQFAEEAFVSEPGTYLESHEIFSKYELWADFNGIKKPLGQNSLTRRLVRLGLKQGRTNCKRVLYGVRFVTDEDVTQMTHDEKSTQVKYITKERKY
jgi:putative DNA primase/helicase